MMDLDKYMDDRRTLLLEKNKLVLKLNTIKRSIKKVEKGLAKSDMMLIKNYKPEHNK